MYIHSYEDPALSVFSRLAERLGHLRHAQPGGEAGTLSGSADDLPTGDLT